MLGLQFGVLSREIKQSVAWSEPCRAALNKSALSPIEQNAREPLRGIAQLFRIAGKTEAQEVFAAGAEGRAWRQPDAKAPGKFVDYPGKYVNPNMSFLEMLDVVNDELTAKGEEPIAFAHDCREGICGTCSCTINGKPHGPGQGIATCQVYMRVFHEGDVIVVEPFRAKAFPVVKDLIVDRSAFDRVIAAGGFVSVNTGGTPDGNAQPIPKDTQEEAMDAAACIGCGACVAACPNASAMLFVASMMRRTTG